MEDTQELERSLGKHSFKTLARRLSRRTWFALLGLAGIGAALYVGWGWLAAAGLTTVIVGVLPCVVMCGLGLCAKRMGGNGASSCHGDKNAVDAESVSRPQSKT